MKYRKEVSYCQFGCFDWAQLHPSELFPGPDDPQLRPPRPSSHTRDDGQLHRKKGRLDDFYFLVSIEAERRFSGIARKLLSQSGIFAPWMQEERGKFGGGRSGQVPEVPVPGRYRYLGFLTAPSDMPRLVTPNGFGGRKRVPFFWPFPPQPQRKLRSPALPLP